MIGVKSVKVDGEELFVFNSVIYIFESLSERTLAMDLIVSEVALKKYKDRENLIVEIELEDGRVISSFMFVNTIPGKLPRLNLFCDVGETDEYEGILRLHENDRDFPDIEAGITLQDIRKVEMPNEKVTLKLRLPVDQVEWLREQKTKDLNAIFRELIGHYMEK